MAHLLDMIEYQGDNTTFVWRHPSEDFHTGTQLVVLPSQEAVFLLNGQALDLFGPGRHTLTTPNIPLLQKTLNLATGGRTPFRCSVYFINKVEQMAVKWGTDTQLEYLEPAYQFPIKLGASGEMSLRAEDSRKLLIKLVGAEGELTQQGLLQKFRGILMAQVKSYLAGMLREGNISVFSIDERLSELSAALREKLRPDFEDYGIALERFCVTTIVKPEDDPAYQACKALHFRKYADVAEAELRRKVGVMDAETMAQKRALEGYTYQEERAFDVAQRVAENPVVGQMTNLGVGLGMLSGVGGAMGGAVGGMVQGAMGGANQAGASGNLCPACGVALPANAKFCHQCGQKV